MRNKNLKGYFVYISDGPKGLITKNRKRKQQTTKLYQSKMYLKKIEIAHLFDFG